MLTGGQDWDWEKLVGKTITALIIATLMLVASGVAFIFITDSFAQWARTMFTFAVFFYGAIFLGSLVRGLKIYFARGGK
ncbi:MAG: hypothetical protein EBT20_08475 [Alphaproteobacteria bacterium]|nr:hypothetical protein [Alphaproteobacteria bacterium]